MAEFLTRKSIQSAILGTIQAMASRRTDGRESSDKPKATVEVKQQSLKEEGELASKEEGELAPKEEGELAPKEEDELAPSNKFANDGSFLEMFKRMQEARSGQGSHSEPVTPKLVTEPATSSRGPEGSVKQQSVRMIQVF